jgi:hypothetical protein
LCKYAIPYTPAWPSARKGVKSTRYSAVTPHLLHRVEHRLPIPRNHDQAVVALLGVRPLLQLDENVGVSSGPRIGTAEQGIDPLRCQGQSVLEENLQVAESGVLEVAQERRQAVAPGVDLAHPGRSVEADARLPHELLVQLPDLGLLEQDVGTVTDQSHQQFPHEACVIGMRVGASTSRRLGARRAARAL